MKPNLRYLLTRTHCAGTIASKTYGVAKAANVYAVKVLNAQGSGAFSAVIAGINWVAANVTAEGRVGKAVASMSLGGGKTQALNDAIAAAVTAGIPFIVAGT